jgi:predicted acyltransferase
LFLFLSGVSWPFSYSSQVAHGKTQGHIHLKLFIRVVTLFLLGLSFGGFLEFNPNFRMMSVLGFIGISWGIAALLYIHIKKNIWHGQRGLKILVIVLSPIHTWRQYIVS